MSEELRHNGAEFKAPRETAESTAEHAEKHHEQHETETKHEKPEQHSEHKKAHEGPTAEGEALKAKLANTGGKTELPPPNRALKAQARRAYLGKIRHHLSGPEKGFSKWIHNPGVNAVSEATGKTVARPSGVLVGGLFVLISSGYYLYLTKHNNYRYSFTIVLVLFLVGFLVGLVVELFYKLIFRRSKRATSVKHS